MLFPEEDAALLKAWIVKRIENTSDADSDVLAEYMIALLKHDGNHQDIRELCEAEIPDFLTEEPKAFLDDVFRAIEFRSYKPRAPPPPPKSISQPPARNPPSSAADATAHTASKKRLLSDRGDAIDVADHDRDDCRSMKQPRRGGRRGLEDGRGTKHAGYRPVLMPPIPTGMPHFDPKNPMDAIMKMQVMGITFPGLQPFAPPSLAGKPMGRQSKWKGRCRDFDTKGYCSRGSTCMYDHGKESIFVPPLTVQEYDPSDAVMNMPAIAMQESVHAYNADLARGRDGRKSRATGHRGHRKGGARAPFSAEGPVLDRSKSTIVVENIPEESFNEDIVRAFFSKFGNIVQVSMQPYKHLALVKFDTWSAANDAYRSPKVIFDNRFVKVFWFREEGDTGLSGNGPSDSVSAGAVGAAVKGSEPEVDLEELQRKQQDAQKQHQERQSKREELERQRQALEQQQQDLLAKHQAETEQLRARLAEKNGGSAASGSSGTEMLKAQLAALEGEAKMLGLDPNAADDTGMPGFRGGGYRGRRAYRGRRGLAPRGQDSFRGQGAWHAAYAHYSIDNRPKKLAIHGVDFTPSDKDEALRHFLLNLGEFESVETSPTVTHVSFQDRKTAEKFFHCLNGKELAGVDGKLDLSWVTAAAPAAAAPQPASPSDGVAGQNTNHQHHRHYHQADGDDSHGSPREGPVARRQVDMDYEIGDDDAWGDGVE